MRPHSRHHNAQLAPDVRPPPVEGAQWANETVAPEAHDGTVHAHRGTAALAVRTGTAVGCGVVPVATPSYHAGENNMGSFQGKLMQLFFIFFSLHHIPKLRQKSF